MLDYLFLILIWEQILNWFKNLLKSPHIQIAFASGVSIVVLAYFSKRVFNEQIGDVILGIPPFIAFIFELILNKYQNSKFAKTWYWVTGIFLSAGIIIITKIL